MTAFLHGEGRKDEYVNLAEYGWMNGLVKAAYPYWEKRDDYFYKADKPAGDFAVLQYGNAGRYQYIYVDFLKGALLSYAKSEGVKSYTPDSGWLTEIVGRLSSFTDRNFIYDGTAQIKDGYLFHLSGRIKGRDFRCASYTLEDWPDSTDMGAVFKDNKAVMRLIFNGWFELHSKK